MKKINESKLEEIKRSEFDDNGHCRMNNPHLDIIFDVGFEYGTEYVDNCILGSVTKRNWFQRQRVEYRYLMYMGTGILIGLILPYVW